MKKLKLATLLLTTTMFVDPTFANGGRNDDAAASSSAPGPSRRRVADEGEVAIGMRFDGHVIRGLLAINRVYDSPYLNEATRHIPYFSDEGEVRGHEGNEVIFTRLFDIDTGQVCGDTGKYTFLGNLEDNEHTSLYNPDALFFSDGMGGYFCTRTSQVRLQQGESRFVGGFIVSYDPRRRLMPTVGASLHADRLPRGLFMIDSFKSQNGVRQETWRLLDNQNPAGFSRDFIVSSPLKSPSIPGIDGFFPYQTQAPTGEAGQLHQAALRMRERVESITLPDTVQGAIYVLGPSGRGKSTLVTALGGGLLEAKRDRSRRYSLQARQPVEGIHIADTMRRGTKEPTWCLSPDQDYAIFDCPGFGDPAGGQSDIIFSYVLRTLLQTHGNLKIMLTLKQEDIDDRSKEFVDLLNQVTRVFADDERLRRAVTLVITKNRGEDVPEILNMLLEEVEDPAHRAEIAIDDRAITLLREIAADPERVVVMPYPRVQGLYPTEELHQSVSRALGKVSYEAFGPDNISLSISPDGRVKARQYGDSFSKYVKDYIAGEGNRRLLKVCKKMLLEKSYTDVDHLRRSLTTLGDEIEAFHKTPVNTVPELLERLRDFVGGALCKDSQLMLALETLSFLKDVDQSIPLPLTEWVGALSESVSQIRHLTQPPEIELSDGHILAIKGSLASLTEIATLFASHGHGKTLIEVLITNKLFFNDNFHAPGISLSIHSPQWIIPMPVTVNLNGNKGGKGDDGAHASASGRPGLPGQNGGNFYGNAHYIVGLDNLTVTTLGGAGGDGGNGANGANGRNGIDGNGTSGSTTEEYVSWTKHRFNYRDTYLHSGTLAEAGGNGGAGGQGGHPGHNGSWKIVGFADAPTMEDSARGASGQAGNGGIGGKHGRNYTSVRFKSHKEKHRQRRELKSAYWEKSPGIVERPEGQQYAANGATPTALNTTAPTAPPDQPSIEPNQRTRKFVDHLTQESSAGHVVHIFADSSRDAPDTTSLTAQNLPTTIQEAEPLLHDRLRSIICEGRDWLAYLQRPNIQPVVEQYKSQHPEWTYADLIQWAQDAWVEVVVALSIEWPDDQVTPQAVGYTVPEGVELSPDFNPVEYLRANQGLPEYAFVHGVKAKHLLRWAYNHYVQYGMSEGRVIKKENAAQQYRALLQKANWASAGQGTHIFQHPYINVAINNFKRAHSEWTFAQLAVVAQKVHFEVFTALSLDTPMEHMTPEAVGFTLPEGFVLSPNFNPLDYLRASLDLPYYAFTHGVQPGGLIHWAYQHYVGWGKREGRRIELEGAADEYRATLRSTSWVPGAQGYDWLAFLQASNIQPAVERYKQQHPGWSYGDLATWAQKLRAEVVRALSIDVPLNRVNPAAVGYALSATAKLAPDFHPLEYLRATPGLATYALAHNIATPETLPHWGYRHYVEWGQGEGRPTKLEGARIQFRQLLRAETAKWHRVKPLQQPTDVMWLFLTNPGLYNRLQGQDHIVQRGREAWLQHAGILTQMRDNYAMTLDEAITLNSQFYEILDTFFADLAPEVRGLDMECFQDMNPKLRELGPKELQLMFLKSIFDKDTEGFYWVPHRNDLENLPEGFHFDWKLFLSLNPALETLLVERHNLHLYANNPLKYRITLAYHLQAFTNSLLRRKSPVTLPMELNFDLRGHGSV